MTLTTAPRTDTRPMPTEPADLLEHLRQSYYTAEEEAQLHAVFPGRSKAVKEAGTAYDTILGAVAKLIPAHLYREFQDAVTDLCLAERECFLELGLLAGAEAAQGTPLDGYLLSVLADTVTDPA